MNKQFVESAAKQAKFLSGKNNDWLHLIDQLEQNKFEVQIRRDPSQLL